MVAGKILYRDGKYMTLEEAEILKKSEPIIKNLKMANGK
jgi:hypothetical protein